MRGKNQFKLKHLLAVPVVLFIFWFAGFASLSVGVNSAPFMEQLALASTSPGLYAQIQNMSMPVNNSEPSARRDYGPVLRNASMPIVNNRAILGVSLRTCPESNAVYRSRREGLLDEVAAARPDRRVMALVLLDRLYAPEEMAGIIDPAQVNVIGIGAFVPYKGAFNFPPDELWHGLSVSHGLMRTGIPRRIIPTNITPYRLLERWHELRSKWEEMILTDQYVLDHIQSRLDILKAGEIMRDFSIGVTVDKDGDSTMEEVLNIFTEPQILAMSPSERAQSKYYRQAIADQEHYLKSIEGNAGWKRRHLQKDAGIYAVTVEGTAVKINELRGHPEIDLVDPVLFNGILGSITSGGYNPLLEIVFSPPKPAPYDYPIETTLPSQWIEWDER